VQPPEPALPRQQEHSVHHVTAEDLHRRPYHHLPVVSRHHQSHTGRQRVEQIGHDPVCAAELGIVVLA
jgi:hypothetical protein